MPKDFLGRQVKINDIVLVSGWHGEFEKRKVIAITPKGIKTSKMGAKNEIKHPKIYYQNEFILFKEDEIKIMKFDLKGGCING